jgi:hypothetical protein
MTERSEYTTTTSPLTEISTLRTSSRRSARSPAAPRPSPTSTPITSTAIALYWSDFVTDLLDDCDEAQAAELEACGWPALMETLEEQQYNARHP